MSSDVENSVDQPAGHPKGSASENGEGMHLYLDLTTPPNPDPTKGSASRPLPAWIRGTALIPSPGQWTARLDSQHCMPSYKISGLPQHVLGPTNSAPIPATPPCTLRPSAQSPRREARVSDVRRPPSDAQVPPRPQAPPRRWPFPASRSLSHFSRS